MNLPYRVELSVFQGPLDLLLQLIERAELDVTSVALAQVTDQYLERLRSLPEAALDDLASFLVIAARLLQIKSEALLPQPPIREPGEEDPGEALARQLLLYRRFKQIAGLLEARESEGLRTYLRLSSPPPVEPRLDLEGVGLEHLRQALMEALGGWKERPSLEAAVDAPKVRIRDVISQVMRALERRPRVRFKTLLAKARTRLEIVVSFLAVLELIKWGAVEAQQEVAFGEILLVRGRHWGERQEGTLESEFEE